MIKMDLVYNIIIGKCLYKINTAIKIQYFAIKFSTKI
jgi:hypothetical protein